MTATSVTDTHRPGSRTPHSVRLAGDTKARMKKAVKDGEAEDVQQWGERVIEAALGFVRCRRGSCSGRTPPIPVTFGDIAGMTFGEAAAKAVELVEDQHRSGHHPVTIGNAAPEAPRAPGSVVFLEPGGRPVTAAMPEVPASRNTTGRRS